MGKKKKPDQLGIDQVIRLANFLFEANSMRRLPRMHMQTLGTNDHTDTIAAHTFGVSMIGWTIALMEGLDVGKVLQMCLLHDFGEIRTGDHNYIHKRYMAIDEAKIQEEQLGSLPFPHFETIAREYHERKTPEALAAKDADLIHQMVLLKEHAVVSDEAKRWLANEPNREKRLSKLKLPSSHRLAEAILDGNTFDWWKDIWTPTNRTL